MKKKLELVSPGGCCAPGAPPMPTDAARKLAARFKAPASVMRMLNGMFGRSFGLAARCSGGRTFRRYAVALLRAATAPATCERTSGFAW
jgi:hypothetical protein